jgi:conjugal transfer/type IV secretion protein DotA/TraY
MMDLLAKPSCDDIAWGWILTLFGTDGTCAQLVNAANVNTPYANAFAVLTAALAFFGGLFMAYHTVAGIVSTAHSGKVLGERWHQIWAPLRIVLGFGLLIPVGDGFSSIHYILRDVVGVAAVQLANGVVFTYANTAYKDVTAGSVSKVSTLAGRDYAQKFFEKEVCTGIVGAMSSGFFTWYSYSAESPKEPGWFKLTESALKQGQVWDYGSCGKLVLEYYVPGANDGIFSTDGAKAKIELFNEKRADATEALRQTIRDAKFMDYPALGTFIDNNSDSIESSADSIIKKLREEGTIAPGVQAKLDAAAKKWDDDVSAAASDVFSELTANSRTGLVSQITKHGFMIAGAFERSLATVSGTVSGLANAQMTSTTPVLDEDALKKIAFAQSVITSSKVVDNTGTASGAVDSNTDSVSGVLQSIMPSNLGNMFSGKATADPVGDMIMFGNNLMTAASYSLMVVWGLKAAAAGVGGSVAGWFGAGAVSSMMDSLANWISWIIMIMIIVGLMHSFVLPMLPMIMVFTMGVSWLVMFLEGSIAGVLWAFIFIRMDGQEFFDQKQSPGVGLLFNLLLRPALGMLAFCGMLLLLPALLNTLNQVWAQAFSLQSGNHGYASLVWLWQWVASMVMFCWMQWTLTLRITSLIPTIADRVGHWMGVSSTSGYGDGQETTANVGAMIAASQAISKAPIQGGGAKRPPGGGGGGGDMPRGNPDGRRSSQGRNGQNKFKK